MLPAPRACPPFQGAGGRGAGRMFPSRTKQGQRKRATDEDDSSLLIPWLTHRILAGPIARRCDILDTVAENRSTGRGRFRIAATVKSGTCTGRFAVEIQSL